MKIETKNLTIEQVSLLTKINTELEHTWNTNVNRILKQGTYTQQDKVVILDPLRRKYIEHLKNTKS